MKTKFSGILTLLLVLIVQVSFAQSKTITGTVNDDTGLPLPGANVLVEGTTNGTQTDFDGKFSIEANQGQTIVFSYIGFDDQEVVVDQQSSITIQMKEGNTLGEVVITGYTKKSQLVSTSASVSVSAAEIAELNPTTSIDNLLQGKAAGVQVTAANGKPGQGAFVRIRGTGSLTAGASSPLYVVDGAVIREQDLGSIAPETIENISVLKDAATTARYGSRGANGVVIITTKSGKRNKDAVINFNSRYGVISRINPNFDVMNTQQKLRYERELFALGITAASQLPGVTTDPGSPERQFLLDNSTDWEDLVLKDGIVQSNNVSISGGSEKADYFFTVGHDRNTGIIDQITGLERINTRLNVNLDAKDWLNVGVNVGYSRSVTDEPRDRNNVQNAFRAMYDYNPYETEFEIDDEGNVILDENGNPIYSATHTGFNLRGALITEPAKNITNNLLASTNATVTLSKNFNYNFRVAFNSINFRGETYSQPGGILDAFLGDNGNKNDFGTYRYDFTISNSLGYNVNSGKHNFNALALQEFNYNENNNYQVRSTNFPSPLLTTQANGADLDSGTTGRNILTLVSYGLFADYDYDERYLFSASIRADASSNFGTDNQYGTFWSASAGWNVARESFFNVSAIDDLKLRASYGTVGNRNGIGRYASQGTEIFGSYPGGPSTIPGNIANPDLKWETTTTTNVGIEYNLFNRRVRGVADYFIRNTEDLLFQIPGADESGVQTVNGNLGEIENKGIELSLQADIFRSSNFTWTLGGNIALIDSEIVALPGGEDVTPGNAFNIRWSEGRKINEHYLVRYAGVDSNTGRPLYLNAAGESVFADQINEDEDRVFQGKSVLADKEGGFFSNIKYKGWGLRTDFTFKGGNYVNNFVRANLNSDGVNIDDNQAVSALNYWKQPGDTGVEPSPIYQDELDINSDRFLEKGDFIRLRNISLSYTFPKKSIQNTPLSNLRVYLQGQNLLTFTDFYGDPEVGISSGETINFANSVAPGEATLYSYPNTQSFQIGLDVSF